jgi:hypothetical protein
VLNKSVRLQEQKMKRLLTIGILIIATQTALAQSERRECPGLKAGAADDQQAQCWFEKAQKCTIDALDSDSEANECIQQAARWCASALLDDPVAANSCFLANLRAGKLDEALALKRYLRQPTVEVGRCRQALEGVSVKFVSEPAGAQIRVNGQPYGKTPVEVELPGRWWQGSISARFGVGDNATEAEVPQKALMDAFDTHACTMAEVTAKGPALAQPSTQTPQPLSSQAPRNETQSERRAGTSVPGIILTAAGGAGIVAGGVLLAIALSRRADILSVSKDSSGNNEQWTKAYQDKADSVKPLSIGGFAALGAGAALATVGIVLLVNHGASSESAVSAATPTLQLTGQGVQLSGSF